MNILGTRRGKGRGRKEMGRRKQEGENHIERKGGGKIEKGKENGERQQGRRVKCNRTKRKLRKVGMIQR